MIAALAFAVTALFVANNEFLPQLFRQPMFMYIPVALLYVAMGYWLFQVVHRTSTRVKSNHQGTDVMAESQLGQALQIVMKRDETGKSQQSVGSLLSCRC